MIILHYKYKHIWREVFKLLPQDMFQRTPRGVRYNDDTEFIIEESIATGGATLTAHDHIYRFLISEIPLDTHTFNTNTYIVNLIINSVTFQ